MSEISPEGRLYECKNCGRVFRGEAGQQRQECPACHSDKVEEVEKTVDDTRPGWLQRLLGRRSS